MKELLQGRRLGFAPRSHLAFAAVGLGVAVTLLDLMSWFAWGARDTNGFVIGAQWLTVTTVLVVGFVAILSVVEFADVALEETDGRGVDAAFDIEGSDRVSRCLKGVRAFGRVACILPPQGALTAVYTKNLTLHGVFLTRERKRLEEMLRLAEVELSMERARIGREQSQLQQQQAAIEKQMRRLGLKTVDEQHAESPDVSTADRRWIRFLGLPRT